MEKCKVLDKEGEARDRPGFSWPECCIGISGKLLVFCVGVFGLFPRFSDNSCLGSRRSPRNL